MCNARVGWGGEKTSDLGGRTKDTGGMKNDQTDGGGRDASNKKAEARQGGGEAGKTEEDGRQGRDG